MVTPQRSLFSLSCACAIVFGGGAARAQEPAPSQPSAEASAPPPVTRVHHGPISVATAHEPIELTANVERHDLAKRVVAVYSTPATGGLREVPFDRTETRFVAVIPAEVVVAPEVDYAIEIVAPDGSRMPAFASREHLHAVQVPDDDVAGLRERALFERLDRRRSVVEVSGEYVFFGESTVPLPSGPQPVRDEYWRTDVSYTYRFLRTVAEFGLRFGVVRGSAPVLNATDASQFNVGLNYGAPRLRLRLTDWCDVEGEFLTSVTEVGFSLGGGGSVLFGDAYGTHLTLGVEGIEIFGVRTWTELDVAAGRRVQIGATVEVSNMPHADTAGVRLLLDARIDLGKGFGLSLRGGYQARTFDLGGPGGGLGLSYAF